MQCDNSVNRSSKSIARIIDHSLLTYCGEAQLARDIGVNTCKWLDNGSNRVTVGVTSRCRVSNGELTEIDDAVADRNSCCFDRRCEMR